jgi:hypothetical protein
LKKYDKILHFFGFCSVVEIIDKNNKKGIFIWKIFIFHKNLAEKYVPMATMICVKHFLNIPDIFFLFLLYKNNTKKGLLKKIIFHKNLGKNMLP